MNTNTFRNLSYGVYVLGVYDTQRNRPTGCTVNSVMQITSSPATVAVSVNHDNYTNECIKRAGEFSVNILPEAVNPEIIGIFGFNSGRDTDKFDKVECDYAGSVPYLAAANGYVVLKVIDTMETATHTVFLGEVKEAEVLSDAPSMTYAYYHKVIRGKSPKNAPTYIAEEKPETGYKCEVCGYVYDGKEPFESLPDSYVCPICNAPKSAFKKL